MQHTIICLLSIKRNSVVRAAQTCVLQLTPLFRVTSEKLKLSKSSGEKKGAQATSPKIVNFPYWHTYNIREGKTSPLPSRPVLQACDVIGT